MDTYKNMLESMYPILKAKRGEFWVYTEPDDEVDYIFIFSNFDHNHYVRDICGLEFDGTYFNATRIRHSLLGGASYSPHFKESKKLPNGTFWICPVTLFVLGEYPEFFWIHPLKLSRDRYLGLGLPPANPFYKDNK